ncbi:glycogen debranching protein GlgX [Vacuolonema iberomarrocanum]|uniref:glycogen debranching protein GlgX n=1 Tax=Vacuolonema iberomarrocanum TaxID=3454632 RepID=UPI0019E131A0|nr:glycogen debranching protein GlgX [filamentous cyanobacterium LEGE 07170]
MAFDTLPGRSFPLGTTVTPIGVNFCIFSKSAEAMELLLFDAPDDAKPSRVISLSPQENRSFHYWHVFVPGVQPGQIYGYRAYGPFVPDQGYRFDPSKVLLDPYAKAIVNEANYDRLAAAEIGYDNCAEALKGVVVDTSRYDWEGDRLSPTSYNRSIIYEMHVAGFTKNPNSGVAPEKRGTYAGVVDKIPYLKALGITAVELLPVHFFDPKDAPPGLPNYWGYSTIGFFAPHQAYSSTPDPLGALDEFRDMVKAFHRAGIEVILDVVFNHTAEGNEDGPTLAYRGLENSAYYILEPERQHYRNYSGCGNAMRANHPIVSQLILDSLRYWVSEMHVDGFRFDLASVLWRDDTGLPVDRSPILWTIEMDPVLARTKIIAEAWDAAGLYQVGKFVGTGDRFAEWNGPFRDDARRFVKSDPGMVGPLAARLMGSPDIYPQMDYDTTRSINFVTCHDGFTLNDVVSYNKKDNTANNEENRDGANDNHSWNCGIEGETDDSDVLALRDRQAKNLLSVLFLSQGTPMLLMGDEVRRTQQGNNNSYCQDNILSWFDWDKVDENADLLRFTREFIRFIQNLNLFQLDRVLTKFVNEHDPYVSWHGRRLGEPEWDEDSHTLAMGLHYPDKEEHLYCMFNAYWEPQKFDLPPLKQGDRWHRIVDTFLLAPDDFSPRETAPSVSGQHYAVHARSVVALMAF